MFKKGDKVKIIANTNSSRNHVGDIGTITGKSPFDSDLWVVEVPGRGEGRPFRGANTKESEMEKVEDMYEDQWHLNDGKVTIPDDADKLEKDGSVVAFRKRKVVPLKFGDELIGKASGSEYKFICMEDSTTISVYSVNRNKVFTGLDIAEFERK